MKYNFHAKIVVYLVLFSSLFSTVIILPTSQKRLKILFITDKFPYSPRKYIDNQITGLIDLGHEVYILAKRVSPHADYPLVHKYNLLDRTFYNSLPEHLKEFDILYCQFGKIGNYCLDLVKKKKISGKIVVCFRGGDASKYLLINPHIYDTLFKKADLLMPVCYNFKKNIIKFGANPRKVMVHHSAIDCSQFKFIEREMPKSGPIVILTVGRLVRMKGIDYAIRAFKKISALYPRVVYEIVGEGVEHDRLVRLVKDLHLQNRVKILGYLPHDQVIEKLRQAHIFLLASNTKIGEQEGIPNAVMEAMATGLPVVVTAHSGLCELVKNGTSGFLVREKDVTSIADRLSYLLRNSHLWPEIGAMGREHVLREHNKIIANERLVEIFRSLL